MEICVLHANILFCFIFINNMVVSCRCTNIVEQTS